jgi:Calcineurin-like phosphoesterase
MKLWAISDLHVDIEQNRAGLLALKAHPEDWLITAGDLCEGLGLFAEALGWLTQRFGRVIWVPGNHELWLPESGGSSIEQYKQLVEVARSCGVLTPEDPYVTWPPTGDVIVPLCTLYDYSFRPSNITLEGVVEWAAELKNVAADEKRMGVSPLSGMAEWCAMRCSETEERLARELPSDARTILVGHYPLREDLVHIPRIPRFTPWCGTQLTKDWHRRFRAVAAVSGHLHVRRRDVVDGTRFEEVSLGYPGQWRRFLGVNWYLREIVPEKQPTRFGLSDRLSG